MTTLTMKEEKRLEIIPKSVSRQADGSESSDGAGRQ